ncbi:MAG: WecB/TagA/CpsF family glycosyltransferase [Chloroflexi bacterium]|nr:WecB/TagA/CpsF family glycosyltransferase [Chloroflexota bacterium]
MAETQLHPSRRPRSLSVLGVRVDDITFAETLAMCAASIVERRPLLIATVNTEFVMAARGDAQFRRVLAQAGLAVPDGIGLLLAARLSGHPIREHVRGSELVERLAVLGAREGYRLFFLGGRQGAASLAAANLARRYPGLQVVGCYEGSGDRAGDAETVAAVRGAGAVDVLLVAYGAPKQEEWLARNQVALGVPVGIGVGGVFDFFSGRVPRAPLWLRRLELEWLYRLLTQPWRWRRQLALPRFLALVLASFLARRSPVRDLGPLLRPGGEAD